jgi:hypothetical protein
MGRLDAGMVGWWDYVICAVCDIFLVDVRLCGEGVVLAKDMRLGRGSYPIH